MEIPLNTGENIPDISILNTYAPHMGYNYDDTNSELDRHRQLFKYNTAQPC